MRIVFFSSFFEIHEFFSQVFSREYCKIFKNSFCYKTPAVAFDITLIYTLEFIAFSSRAMSLARFLQLRINRYKRENDKQKCLLMIFFYFCF